MIAFTSSLLAQGDGGEAAVAAAAFGIIGLLMLLFELALIVLIVAGMWKMFSKAGQPGWAAIIPIYNVIVLLEIVGKPIWWFLLFMIPLVNIVIMIIVYIELAASFGKGGGFAVGLILLPFIFVPMLGFGSATYQGAPAAAA